MPNASIKKVIPCKKTDLINMILDIEKYPEFVPWCLAGKIHRKDDMKDIIEIEADLTVGKKYSITYTITSYTSGNVVTGIGDLLGNRGTTRNATGTYTDIVTFSSNTTNDYFGFVTKENPVRPKLVNAAAALALPPLIDQPSPLDQ